MAIPDLRERMPESARQAVEHANGFAGKAPNGLPGLGKFLRRKAPGPHFDRGASRRSRRRRSPRLARRGGQADGQRDRNGLPFHDSERQCTPTAPYLTTISGGRER